MFFLLFVQKLLIDWQNCFNRFNFSGSIVHWSCIVDLSLLLLLVNWLLDIVLSKVRITQLHSLAIVNADFMTKYVQAAIQNSSKCCRIVYYNFLWFLVIANLGFWQVMVYSNYPYLLICDQFVCLWMLWKTLIFSNSLNEAGTS